MFPDIKKTDTFNFLNMFVQKQKKTKNTFFLISGQVLDDACCNVFLFIEIYIRKA